MGCFSKASLLTVSGLFVDVIINQFSTINNTYRPIDFNLLLVSVLPNNSCFIKREANAESSFNFSINSDLVDHEISLYQKKVVLNQWQNFIEFSYNEIFHDDASLVLLPRAKFLITRLILNVFSYNRIPMLNTIGFE